MTCYSIKRTRLFYSPIVKRSPPLHFSRSSLHLMVPNLKTIFYKILSIIGTIKNTLNSIDKKKLWVKHHFIINFVVQNFDFDKLKQLWVNMLWASEAWFMCTLLSGFQLIPFCQTRSACLITSTHWLLSQGRGRVPLNGTSEQTKVYIKIGGTAFTMHMRGVEPSTSRVEKCWETKLQRIAVSSKTRIQKSWPMKDSRINKLLWLIHTIRHWKQIKLATLVMVSPSEEV